MIYQSSFWSLEIPEGWSFESDSSAIAFYHPEGVGTIHVSCHQKNEAVIDEDLSEFADGARVSAIALPGFEGMRSRYAVEERYWEKYWLRNGTLMLHVTYNCALEDQGTEHEQVIAILESLRAAI